MVLRRRIAVIVIATVLSVAGASLAAATTADTAFALQFGNTGDLQNGQ